MVGFECKMDDADMASDIKKKGAITHMQPRLVSTVLQ
jgi:hypothetical protein